MDLKKLEQNIETIVKGFSEGNNQKEFIYEFLLAYQFPKSSITRLKKGDYNKSKHDGEILWKKNLFFKIESQQDLHLTIDEAQKNQAVLKQHPRFIIITDFKTLLAVDTKIGDSLDIPFVELSKNVTFFLPWMGMEKTQIQSLDFADVKAAEKLAQLYDIIIQENHIETDSERHELNIFLSRLLFCFFAEDTGIFKAGLFTNAIASHTSDDGHDLQDYLVALFKTLNIEKRSNESAHFKDFEYVNGGLFSVDYPVPKLNAKARKMMIDSGKLNWKQINPDIFGSMMQAVVHSDQRGSLGMHYTSVANIMKVIEPLFLNDLKEQLESAENSESKLTKLLDRLYHLRLFDPACGSGNFLIIAYKELCKLEIEIFKQLQQISNKWNTATSGIRLTQFYGIELDDFAHETAKLSLWLAEHQMNLAFKTVFGSAKPTLPLQEGGNIVCGNATRVNWEEVCPKEEGVEIYIMGNPPYLGSSMQSKEQKEDMKIVFKDTKGYKNLDYISCWFLIGSEYIQGINSKLAFVSTNSICQGQQVAMLWPNIFSLNIEIGFAHQSFKWTNHAKGNAGVTCIVVGLRNESNLQKRIFKGGIHQSVRNINAYLANGSNLIVLKRSKPLSSLPIMTYGNKAVDGGHLILSKQESDKIINEYPESSRFIKKLSGSSEFIRSSGRFCLWLTSEDIPLIEKILPIQNRINKVEEMRLRSRDVGANKLASRPHQFRDISQSNNNAIIIPRVSSERRSYIPVGFLENDTIILDSAQAIYDPESWVFAIVSSRTHMTWVRTVAGRLKTDYRYSSALCYNTFPFPEITEAQKTTLEDHVFNVLDEREKYPEKTIAELYDPDKMPEGLRQAHHEMDLAVEQCYRKKLFKSDEERLEYLFKRYEEMIEAEKAEKNRE